MKVVMFYCDVCGRRVEKPSDLNRIVNAEMEGEICGNCSQSIKSYIRTLGEPNPAKQPWAD